MPVKLNFPYLSVVAVRPKSFITTDTCSSGLLFLSVTMPEILLFCETDVCAIDILHSEYNRMNSIAKNINNILLIGFLIYT
jgi:hypothetical protein